MRGYYQYSNDCLQTEANKLGRVYLGGHDVGGITVRTAATPEHQVILLVRRGAVAASPALKNYYRSTDQIFPAVSLGEVFDNGIVFDGKQYAFERYDALTGDIVFYPVAVSDPRSAVAVDTEEVLAETAAGAGVL